jgi:hemerythrin superfamily protein
METAAQCETIRRTLAAHHRRLESMLDAVLAAVRVGDCRDARTQWSVLDTQLTAHLRYEESELFPKLEHFDRAAVTKLRAEHEQLKNDIAELGASIDLKEVSEPNVKCIFDRLREHAGHEEALLYPWVDSHVPLTERVRDSLRRIAGK